MRPVRLGAVDYLNARPLVYGLELRHGFALRFDPPSKCAALLHEGSIDVGMIPSIEYLRRPDYCAVPDLAIVSEGPVEAERTPACSRARLARRAARRYSQLARVQPPRPG